MSLSHKALSFVFGTCTSFSKFLLHEQLPKWKQLPQGATSVFLELLGLCRQTKPESLCVSGGPQSAPLPLLCSPVSLLLPTEGSGLGRSLFFSPPRKWPLPSTAVRKHSPAQGPLEHSRRGGPHRCSSSFVAPRLRWHQACLAPSPVP